MLKNNKGKLILTSLVTLSPILAGLILWNSLPEHMTTHWGVSGEADGFSSRVFAVFGLPLIILAMHWLCVLLTMFDAKNVERNKKMFGIVLWITPVISIFTNAFMYAAALGWKFSGVSTIMYLLIGVSFLVIGNYLPKCRQNFTMGIKLKWTLSNEENWNATHRFGGRVWMIFGILILFCIFLPEALGFGVMMGSVLLAVLIPTVYSYRYYKKQVTDGKAPAKAIMPMSRGMKIIAAAALLAITVLLVIILGTGNVEIEFGENSFTVDANFWTPATVAYTDIRDLEYRESFDAGMRVFGVGSARLLAGSFENDEFGAYTLYAYIGADAAIVMNVRGETLVIRGRSDAETREIFDTIQSKIDALAPID